MTEIQNPNHPHSAQDQLSWCEVVDGGAYWSRVVRRAEVLRIVDLEGSGCVSLLCWSAAQPSERYNFADTVKVQNDIFPTTGSVLLSDLGRVLMSFVADTSGHHDPICGWSDASTTAAAHGSDRDFQSVRNDRIRNAYDNFIAAMGRHGLGPIDLVPNINLFSRVSIDDDGTLSLGGERAGAGAAVELRAEMDVLVVLSNTPHVLDPSPEFAPGRIEVTVRSGSTAAPDDPVRNPSPQVRRAFENTEAHLGLSATVGGPLR